MLNDKQLKEMRQAVSVPKNESCLYETGKRKGIANGKEFCDACEFCSVCVSLWKNK